MKYIIVGWAIAFLLIGNFLTFRVIVPALINLHNDGSLIAAFLVSGIALTVDYLSIKNLGPLLTRDNEE